MKPRIILLAHNIRSLWNVGTLFRNADCFGVEKIYLSGYTATPPRREISKTAIGAEEWIEWEYSRDPHVFIKQLKEGEWTILGLEQTKNSVDLENYQTPEKVCLVLGHEVTGIPEELIQLCDSFIEIPMHGKKESLNVSVACGIALNKLRNNP